MAHVKAVKKSIHLRIKPELAEAVTEESWRARRNKTRVHEQALSLFFSLKPSQRWERKEEERKAAA